MKFKIIWCVVAAVGLVILYVLVHAGDQQPQDGGDQPQTTQGQ